MFPFLEFGWFLPVPEYGLVLAGCSLYLGKAEYSQYCLSSFSPFLWLYIARPLPCVQKDRHHGARNAKNEKLATVFFFGKVRLRVGRGRGGCGQAQQTVS